MGHQKQLNLSEIAQQINAGAYECSSPYNDGFVAWGYKQDLYRIKSLIDDALKRCPTFADEEEWLREQEKKRVIRYLRDQ